MCIYIIYIYKVCIYIYMVSAPPRNFTYIMCIYIYIYNVYIYNVYI